MLPQKGTQEYNRIVALGCGGYTSFSDWGYEYDCEYEYDWICEDCPCVTDNQKLNRE